jgi:DEAD/DEAH box helicase domain-containing protein
VAKTSKTVSSLKALGYELIVWEEPGEEPEKTSVKFSDLVTELNKHSIGSAHLYKHQLESINALEKGENVVLTARTGSGKTEAWAVAAIRNEWRVLAVYPTLALAADQIRRLEEYYKAVGCERAVVRIDRPSLERRGKKNEDVLATLAKAHVVVTNPAFLLAEMKRLAVTPNRALLEDYLSHVDLIVFDELDFYGPRGANLLLAMIELIVKHLSSKPPRVVVLSATLGNPRELAEYLEKLTGRKTRVIKGKPFKTPNRTVIILGKGVEALKDYIRAYSAVIASRAPWVLDVVEDERSFREHFYEVYEALEAIGLHPPRPGLDPVEILQAILESSEPGMVTLVFARSIRMAERLYRGLIERLPQGLHGFVAVHHHLVSKSKREIIEEAAREGRIHIIITVRTLAQGIDIGTVNRVVHVGLPIDLREYMQREGRKGRRREIGVTETIVIPSGLWDRKLLEAGSSALKEWLTLPLEKLYINPHNHYAALFKALWRVLRGIKLSKNEEELLRSMGFVEEAPSLTSSRLVPTRKGKSFWNNIGFYEHGPPYGYRKVVVRGGRETLLRSEEVSVRDAIEKYQPGSYDSMTENIVVRVEPREYRIYEQPPEEAIYENDWLARAVARYEDVKRGWGEKPSFIDDIRYGRLYPIVVLNVSAPMQGFGELVEEPIDVEWLVESRRPRLSRGGNGPRVYHELASIPLNAPISGRYRDYTYGRVFEAPGGVNSEDLRLGLAFLLVYLRINPEYAIPLGLIQYRVVSAGSMKLMHLWEREAAGILDQLDWFKIAHELEGYDYPLISIPLVASIDPPTALRVLRGEIPLPRARDLAAYAARVLAGTTLVESRGIVLEYPRPSTSHGIGAVAVLYDTIQADKGTIGVLAIASYDGESISVDTHHEHISIDQASRMAQILLSHIDKLLSRKLRVVYYGEEQKNIMFRILAGSYTGLMLLRAAEHEGRIVDATSLVPEKARTVPLLVTVEPRVRYYLDWANKAKSRRDVEELENALKRLAEAIAKTAYKVALAALKGRISVRQEKT